jgi:ABC-type transport system involved in multi-copper enzyme maturation permease subunit
MGVLHDIWRWLWRLMPANPILVRVVSAGGKRYQHLIWRIGYLGIVFFVMIIAQSVMSGGGSSLVSLARQSTQVFFYVSVVQLVLMSFIAPVFTAGAITQEKDSNTYNILLTTPLTDGQIVIGSLTSRLYFVIVLLLSGLPIFCITMIYGGVTTAEIFESFGLAACTALITGSIAIGISVTKVGTTRTIFSFYLAIALYLLALGAVGQMGWTQIAEAPVSTAASKFVPDRMGWLSAFHPFLALLVVTGQTPAPSPADVHHYGWPWRWMLVYPHYAYMVITTLISMIIIFTSVLMVRRLANATEAGAIKTLIARFTASSPDRLRRKPRRVWNNPIAWREAATRGSAAGRSSLRWAFMIAGVIGAIVLAFAHVQGWYGVKVADVRNILRAIIWIELAVILLVVTNTAASTLTRERDAGTMDLLLASPLTSNYIVAGMARGLVSFVIPLIAVPTLTVLIFAVIDLFHHAAGGPVTSLEAVILVPLLMIVFSSAAAMIGLLRSLHSRKTTHAVMTATAILFAFSGTLVGCVYAIASAGTSAAALFMPLSPFQAIGAAVDATLCGGPNALAAHELSEVRILRFFSSLASTVAYMVIVVVIYKSLVNNFYMIVRRQSAG